MRLVTMVGCLLLGTLSAANTFSIAVDALLWRPTVDDQYYAILGPSGFPPGTITGKQLAICPGYEFGYRIELGYRCNSNDLRLSWASLNTGSRKHVQAGVGQALWSVDAPPTVALFVFIQGSVQVDNTTHYDVLDADLGHWACPLFDTRLFLGLRYMRIEKSRRTQFFDANGTLQTNFHAKSDVQGTGPLLGLSGIYPLCWDFYLLGETTGEVLFGSAKSSFDRSATLIAITTRVRNASECKLITATDLKFGLGLCFPYGCLRSIDAQITYQMSYYFSGVQRSQFLDNIATGANAIFYRPFMIDGWNFRFGMTF